MTTTKIREEFVQAHLKGEPINLKTLAFRYGRSYAALRQAASKGGWSAQAAAALADRDAHAAEKLAQRNAATRAVLEEAVEREVDVRRRHAHLARVLQQVALERLMTIAPKELTASTAITLLRVGLEEERAALWPSAGGTSFGAQQDHSREQVNRAVEVATEILRRHEQRLRQPRSEFSAINCTDIPT